MSPTIGKPHRSRKRRVTLLLAPVAALAVAVPLMEQASAAAPPDPQADCRWNPDYLESCDFIDVQFKRDSLGPNERVSSVTDNCGVKGEATKSFDINITTARITATENGYVSDGGAKLANSLFEVGAKFVRFDVHITRDDKALTTAYSRTDEVKPNHLGYFMWSAKRTDVSGYLKATYKEAQTNGQKVIYSPSEGATSVHVYYPQLLETGAPDGRLWFRNVKCGTPQAKAILQQPSAALRAESATSEARGPVTASAEPGFRKGGNAVTDEEVPLPPTAAR
jgi:hypothetical protein